MRAHWHYLKYVLRHKWYVLIECWKYGLIWRGIKHDWTKFLPSEWFPYVDYFYGNLPTKEEARTAFMLGMSVKTKEDAQIDFDRAWNHHQKRNSHHWQYHLLSPDKPRPNFGYQSYDGGETNLYICPINGGLADALAIVKDDRLTWWTPPNYFLESQLNADLNNTPVPQDMPMADRKEMIADWKGAGLAQGTPDTKAWYCENRDNIFIHPDTRKWVESELNIT